MNEVFLCLGGNLGDRLINLEKARMLISVKCGDIKAVSRIYETDAWGSNSKLKYLNQVIKISTNLKPAPLLKKLLSIEKQLGRKRGVNKNNDRTMDIDILFYNSDVVLMKDVEIPHARLHLRNFVLSPLKELAPDFKHPVLEKTVSELAKKNKDKLKAIPVKTTRYICIEGNIGSGKTTLAKELSKHLNAVFLPEQFEKNDLLPLFYKDSETYAFPLEYSFLLSRYQQITDTFKQQTQLVIADYSIYKCLWFAAINLQKKDYGFFKKHFEAIEQQLPKPDLIVYLKTRTHNLQKNIKQRGRSYEQKIKARYLEQVSEQYSSGIKKAEHTTLVIEIDKYHPKLTGELIKTIKKKLA